MQNDEVKRCQFQASLELCVVKGFLFNWRSSIFNEVSINWCAQRRTWEASVFVLDVVCCYSCCSNIQRLFTRHPIPLLLDVLHFNAFDVQCAHYNLTSFTLQINWRMWPLLWLSWRKMDKSHIVQIYIDAFLRCHQIWKVETLIGRLNFASGF